MIIGPATRCGPFPCDFELLGASQNIIGYCRYLLENRSGHGGQSATHDGMFPYSPAISIAAKAYRNIYLRILTLISHENSLKSDRKYLRYSNIGSKITCWNSHRRASHAIFLRHRGLGTPHRRGAASQRVAGPYDTYDHSFAIVPPNSLLTVLLQNSRNQQCCKWF